jgi:hypothetical protein
VASLDLKLVPSDNFNVQQIPFCSAIVEEESDPVAESFFVEALHFPPFRTAGALVDILAAFSKGSNDLALELLTAHSNFLPSFMPTFSKLLLSFEILYCILYKCLDP